MVDKGVEASVTRRAAQRERRLFVSLGIALVVGAVIAAAITSVLGPDDGADPRSLPETLILVAAFAVMFGLAVAFLWWRRRRGSTIFARSPLYELPVRRRGPFVRALRRGDPIPADQLDFALRVARDTAGRRGLVWIYVAVAALQGTNAVIQSDRFWQPWFYAVAAVVFLGAAVYWWWLVGRMRLAVTRLTDDR